MLRRRQILSCSVLPFAAALAVPHARAEDVAGYPRAAFDAHSQAELLKALGLPAPVASRELTLSGPELSEDGSVVPVAVACTASGVQRLLIGVERNPNWLAAIFELAEGTEAGVATRLKMQQSSNVVALALLKDGRVLQAVREIKVTLGGCAGAADSTPERSGQPSLIRVQPAAGGGATVRALMKHEMESGQRKDEAGRAVPAWHIQEVVARLNGQAVLSAHWGPAVSKNPFLQFGLKTAKGGDRLALAWADNRGTRRSDEVTLAAI
jgi:sulfur-oxidizing protein SoxY